MPTTHSVMFWNVENFFGTTLNRWTAEPDRKFDYRAAVEMGDFDNRLDALASAVATVSGSATGPTTLGLCEVECDPGTWAAVRDGLNSRLSSGYSLGATPTRSNRAISPILLTRWGVVSSAVVCYDQRIVKVRCTANGTTIYVYVCHWPSKVSDKDGAKRLQTAKILYDSVVNCGAGARVLVMGDLNDNPMAASLDQGLKARNSAATAIASTHPNLVLYDLMTEASYSGKFTHYYLPRGSTLPEHAIKGRIDHFCCTGTLLTGSPAVDLASVDRLNHASISIPDPLTSDSRPWNYGQDDPPGYADHWPIYCTITWS